MNFKKYQTIHWIFEIIAIVVAEANSRKIAIFQQNGEFSIYTYIQKDITASFSAYSVCVWISLYRFRGDKNVPFCYGNENIPDLLFIGNFINLVW